MICCIYCKLSGSASGCMIASLTKPSPCSGPPPGSTKWHQVPSSHRLLLSGGYIRVQCPQASSVAVLGTTGSVGVSSSECHIHHIAVISASDDLFTQVRFNSFGLCAFTEILPPK